MQRGRWFRLSQVVVVVDLFFVVMDVVVVVEMVIIVVVVVEIGIVVKDLVPVVTGIVMGGVNIKTTLVDADINMFVRYVTVIIRDHGAIKEQK